MSQWCYIIDTHLKLNLVHYSMDQGVRVQFNAPNGLVYIQWYQEKGVLPMDSLTLYLNSTYSH